MTAPPPPRASSAVEWLLAAAAITGVLWAAASWVRPYVDPADDDHEDVTAADALPAGVPSGAMSTPLLVLVDGTEVRVGTPESELASTLDGMPAGPPQVSDGAFGRRIIRAYTHGHTRFYVLTESTEPGAPARVTGIYVP